MKLCTKMYDKCKKTDGNDMKCSSTLGLVEKLHRSGPVLRHEARPQSFAVLGEHPPRHGRHPAPEIKKVSFKRLRNTLEMKPN